MPHHSNFLETCTMQTIENNVTLFKYVGQYVEELAEFSAANGGFVAFSMDGETFVVNLKMGEVVHSTSGETLVKATLAMYRKTQKLANGE